MADYAFIGAGGLWNSLFGSSFSSLSLLTSLISYWRLDEPSGSRFDAHGTNHLTDNNTVDWYIGKHRACGNFEASNSEYLTIASNSTLQGGDTDFSFSCWVYLESKAALYPIVSKFDDNLSNLREYMLNYDDVGDRFVFHVNDAVGNNTTIDADALGSPSTSTWYHIVAWHDSVANTINIQVNNGTVDSVACSHGSGTTAVTFMIGYFSDGAAGRYWDGLIDSVGMWRKVLSASEREALYNGGYGLDYPFISIDLLEALTSYWPLDEASSYRNDYGGYYSFLTDNNTVTQTVGQLGAASQFTAANSEYLSTASNAALQAGDIDFTITAWVYLDSLPTAAAAYVVVGKDVDTPANSRDYTLDTFNTGSGTKFRFYVNGGGGGLLVTEPTSLAINTWYFIVASHDSVNNTLNIQLNNGSVTSVSTGGTAPEVSNSQFRIGAREYSGIESYFNGRLDEVGFWKRLLTTDDKTSLYNSGSGSRYPFPPSTHSLLTSLVGHWRLGEVSGSRADCCNINHLSDNNTVTQAAGKLGSAAQFTAANSEYLQIASSSLLSMGNNDFTIAFWVYLDTVPVSDGRTLFSKWQITGNLREYAVLCDWNGVNTRFRFYVSSDGTATTTLPADTLGTPSAGQWYFVVAWHDATADTINIQVNNGTVDSTAHSTGVFNGSEPLQFGTLGLFASYYHDGRLDSASLWRRVLTTGERTALYNSGSGLEYPFTTT